MRKAIRTLLGALCTVIAFPGCDEPLSELSENETTVLPASTNVSATSVQTGGAITVNIWDQKQTIDLLGGGSYFYSGHVMDGITNKTDAHNWLWRDLHVNMYRIVLYAGGVEDANDNSDPNVLNSTGFDFTTNTNLVTQIDGVLKAKSLNSNIKVWAIVLSPPKYLKTNNSVSNGGTLKTSYANAYAEYGEFIFAHLKNLKSKGVTVDYLSLMNEPDVTLDHEDADFTTSQAKSVYSQTANWLKSKLPANAITVPVFTGADPLNVTNADDYINAIKTTNNVGLYTCHQYGGSSESNFATGAAAAGTRGLYMTEWHAGHGMGTDPDEIVASFDLVNKFNDAFRGGARGWMYFEWGNPHNNFGGLLKTPWGDVATRRMNYYIFQQYTNGLLNKKYITTTLSGIANFGPSNVAGFTAGNEATIHIMNWNSDAQNRVRMKFGGLFKNIRIYRTSATESNTLIWSQDNVNLDYYDVDFSGKSFTTVKITW